MARNRIAEIGEVRARKGKYGARFRAETEIDRILALVSDGSLPEDVVHLPVRLVTALEVFTREHVAELVDHGDPYIHRARELTVDFKFDFDLTRALIGKSISFGELMSHAIPLNGVADLDKVFKTLTEKPLTLLLNGVHDRVHVQINEDPPAPIVADVDEMKSTLNLLFEVRHVLVHEMPETRPFTDDLLKQFARASFEFTQAIDQVISSLLYGDYPLTQIEINQRASERAKDSQKELDALLDRVNPGRVDERLKTAQAVWASYAENEATFLSRMDMERHERGSIAPSIYWAVADQLTKERIAWIMRSYGEGWGALD